MYAQMKTGINIQLSPQQLETLRRGEEISFSISLEHDDVQLKKMDIFRSGNPPPEAVKDQMMFLEFFRQQIERLQSNGNLRTSETYQAAHNKFLAFRQGKDIAAAEIDGAMMEALQAFLRLQGLSMNSISFYMNLTNSIQIRLQVDIQIYDFFFLNIFLGRDLLDHGIDDTSDDGTDEEV